MALPSRAISRPPPLNLARPTSIVENLLRRFSANMEKVLEVEVRRLSKAYGFLWALRDINLELRAGECAALLGPNGAGKTTLLKLFSGLLQPTTGDIHINGTRLRHGPARLRPVIGYLSPSDHLYEKLTAEENLRLFLGLYNRPEQRGEIRKALDAAGLPDWSGEYVASLSSGMKCRLSIAKWLLLEPKLLLVDEPYGVLDGGGVDLLESYLKSVCDGGGIVVTATHHVRRVAGVCSRAIILRQGRVIFDEGKRAPWESFHRAVGEFLPRGETWPS